MNGLVLAGAMSGVLVGVVLRQTDLCYHSMIRGVLFERRTYLATVWAVGVSAAALGLAAIYGLSDWDQLNRGLAFDPVANVVGGLLIGVGMVIALSCASCLFYKLGAGMLGALVGVAGWALGELAVRDLELPGPHVYSAGEDATLPGVSGMPRIVVALLLLVAVVAWVRRHPPTQPAGAWGWTGAGIALGVATTLAWILAGWSGADFGPSTVGAPSAGADALGGDPLPDQAKWLLAFLIGIVGGSLAWSVPSGRLWIRGEDMPRYVGLAAGGALLGAGGRIGGGCNLGHGLSGVAQMSISSYVVVSAIGLGVWLAVILKHRLVPRPADTTLDNWQADQALRS